MNWSTFARRPAFLVTTSVLIALAAVWIAVFVVVAQPRTAEQRTLDIASQLRCPVCNGESVAESSTPISQQMRAIIRQQVDQGRSDQQIIAFFRERYGDSILTSPPVSGFTLFIWLGPIVMLLLGAALVILAGRDWRGARPALATAPATEGEPSARLSSDERERLTAVLRRELAADEGLAQWPEEGRV